MLISKTILKSLDKDALIKVIELQEKRIEELSGSVRSFVKKNYVGEPKSDREDYSMMVSCKDVWDLKELIDDK